MAGRVKSNQNSISRLLPEILHEQGWEKQLDLYSIFPRWKEIVGEEKNGCAQPLKIERGVLWLEVTNSSWGQQLQYEKVDLLATLNRFFRQSRLDDIKMVLPKGKTAKTGKAGPAPFPAVKFVKPSEEKIAAFQRQVACIADEQCREALMQLWYLSEACQRETG
jgi:hypothetical protein